MIGIIAAVTMNGVLGLDGKIPFNYPEDMAHFKKTTMDSIVIMGRKTFESIGKPLPNRENIVISSQKIDIPGIKVFDSIVNAMGHKENIYASSKTIRESNKNIWFIGGAKIYEEAMLYANKIVLTVTSGWEFSEGTIKFPWINPQLFTVTEVTTLKIKNPKYTGDQLLIYEYARIT